MKRIFIAIFILLFICDSWASHIKAGEIIVRKNPSNSLGYTFEFILYFDESRISRNPNDGRIDVSSIEVSTGDDSPDKTVFLSAPVEDMAPGVARGVYRTSHTYSGSGNFVVSFSEQYRIANILNISNGGSGSANEELHIDALVRINPSFGSNTSPILTFPPLDLANRGKIYIHNPGAYDPEGDSLVFELITPKKGPNLDVINYRSPSDPIFGGINTNNGPATLEINKKTGEITWNTPGQSGYYNIAIRISEYRSRVLLGYVVRDMQIEVKDHFNSPPKVKAPDELCFEALKANVFDFQVSDTNKNDVLKITTTGSAYMKDGSKPVFIPTVLPNPAPNPYSAKISWTPSCNQVQEQPYQILLKAEEANLSSEYRLSGIKTISIKVMGPKPVWKSIEKTASNTVKLTWDPYNVVCTTAESLRIYRSECNPKLDFDPCSTKVVPSNYKLVGTVDANVSEFIDNNNGIPFKSAIKYYYTMIAYFPAARRGISYAADTIAISFATKNALINSVDVQSSNTIKIKWTNPDLSGTVATYGYEILRSTDNLNYAPIFSKGNLQDLTDTEYIDNSVSLNSATNYYYKITHYSNSDPSVKHSSDAASNLILSYKPLSESAQISWGGALPYNIFKVKIFDVRANKYIDSVENQSSYTVRNLKSCDTTEYIITTYQKYCITEGSMFYTSNSNRIKVAPLVDNTLKFDLTLKKNSCEEAPCDIYLPLPVYDTIVWPDIQKANCTQVVGYNVYFKSVLEQEYTKVGTVLAGDTHFVMPQNITRVGCYQIKVITNAQQEEGATSSTLCVNNDCYCYNLPNIITPNGDNLNDILTPMRYPRFIKSINFILYNRWGTKVYETTDPNIKWDAKNVDAGVYFYTAEIFKYSLDGHDKEEIKGHVTVLK